MRTEYVREGCRFKTFAFRDDHSACVATYRMMFYQDRMEADCYVAFTENPKSYGATLPDVETLCWHGIDVLEWVGLELRYIEEDASLIRELERFSGQASRRDWIALSFSIRPAVAQHISTCRDAQIPDGLHVLSPEPLNLFYVCLKGTNIDPETGNSQAVNPDSPGSTVQFGKPVLHLGACNGQFYLCLQNVIIDPVELLAPVATNTCILLPSDFIVSIGSVAEAIDRALLM